MKSHVRYLFTLLALLLLGIGGVKAKDVTISYIFSSKDWNAQIDGSTNNSNWISGKAGYGLTSDQGIQITTGVSGANATSPISYNNVSKIVVRYCTNAKSGKGSIKVKVGEGEEQSFSVTAPSSGGGQTIKEYTFEYNPNESGNVKVTATCSTNSIYVRGISITYDGTSPSTLDPNDLTLTGAPIALKFDLYDNSEAQTISYTTSSTGAVTVSGGTGYVSTSVDETNKTITVTPTAKTPSVQTITVNQAADATYAAGSASFTVMVNSSTPAILPFNWDGGASSDLMKLAGVTTKGLGSDYAASNAPYLVKFDDTGDWIQVKTDSRPGKVTIDVKMLGGDNTSTITVQGSADGETFANVQTLSISGPKNTELTLEAVEPFAENVRYVRLTFTKGSNVGVGAIAIDKYSAVPAINAENTNIAYDATSGTIECSVVNSVEGGVISASSDSEWLRFGETGVAFTADVNETIAARTANVTLTYTYNTNKTVTKSISVTQAGDPNAPGTENNPYTVAQALEVISDLADGGKTETEIYVTGLISAIDEVVVYDPVENTGYGNATYSISDDGKTTNQLVVFRGKYLNNANFTTTDQIQLCDVVVVKGKLQKYVSGDNTTPEIAQGNCLVSLKRAPAAPTFSIEGGTYNEAQTIELSCVTEGATIQYSIDNSNWVTYSDPIVINETTTITAKAVKDGLESEEVSANYTLRQPGTIRLYFAHDPETNLTAHTLSCGAAVNLNYETNSNGTISIQDMTDGITVIPNTGNKTVTLRASTNNGKVFSQPGEYTFRVVVGETDSYTSASVDFKLKVVKFKSYFNNLTGFEETKDLANGTNGGQLKDQLFSNTQWGDASYKTWTSTNEDVATIDNDGNITLISTGQVRFIHSYTGNDYNEPCKISTGVMTVIDTTPVAAPAKPIVFHDGGEGVTYEGELTVPMFAEEGATIYYTTDGTEPTAASTEYTKPLNISTNTTLKAIAVKDGVESDVVTREYRIEAVDAPDINLDGYYSIKNNNGNYVNVAGRKTVTFVDKNTSKTAAGTVIRVKTTNGKVEVLRSQGVDVPRYAERAMSYVPELVKELMKRLSENVENPIIGEDGANLITDEVMDLDYNLYLEEADGGYRIYGKTPSMQRVVDFYATNKTIIDERLPRLEEFVEDVLLKVAERLDHPNSEWASKFKILDIWAKLVVTNPDLTKPEEGNAEAISKFYTEILSSEANIWNFAHETMMIYWTKVDQLINDPESQYASMLGDLGDYKKYLEKVPNILPNFKYYIVSDGSGIDFISEGNEDIINDAARTVWTLEGRENFNVTFLKDNALSSGRELYTTLYTDFAYKLPDGVKAYAITGVNETTGVATKEEFPSNIIPAQTPVLLQATFDAEQTADQTKTLELTTEAGTTPETNLLVGADYLINEYKINSTQAEGVLNMLKSLSESLYNEYEYLMRKNAGTVNNKYFFGLDDADMELCVYGEDQDCVVRNLGTGENQPLAFYGDWQAPKSNQAFLVSETFNPILLTLKGDVYRDGVIDNKDLTALVEIVLGKVTLENKPENYDFDAAHVNEDEDIDIADVTALVNILNTLQTQTNN